MHQDANIEDQQQDDGTNEKPAKFSCPFCDEKSNFWRAMKKHIEGHTRSKTQPQAHKDDCICSVCGKTLCDQQSLNRHLESCAEYRRKEQTNWSYSCSLCGKMFRFRFSLKYHMENHSDDKPFMCSSCGIQFKQKQSLASHLKIAHTVEK